MVTGGDAEEAGTGPRDARSVALAEYVRRSAAAFSRSADITDVASAEVGAAGRRALVSDVEGGAAIIARLVATAAALDDPRRGEGHP